MQVMTTVLVVDDSRLDRTRAGGILRKAGHEVAFAANGREALDHLAVDLPDVVVTDLQMPELDGLELVEAVRQRYPQIPVILMTAHGSEEIAVRALQKGAASYVPKRSLAQDLCPTVATVLELARGGRPMSRVLDWLVSTESRFVLDNDVSVIPDLVSHLESSITQLKSVDETALIQVGVALREALVNAVYHGNLEVSSKLREEEGSRYDELYAVRRAELPYRVRRVHVTARQTPTEVVYVVSDEGPGFDPTGLPDPTDPSQLEMVSGRGLLLIRTFMDEVTHNERGNEITMVKRLTADPRPAGALALDPDPDEVLGFGAE
jgi:CheY-like chemotaxis protein/anti-sigma regulatory factor (Ser/Thr protein kinase)